MASQLALPGRGRLELHLAVADAAPPLDEVHGETMVTHLGAIDGLDYVAHTDPREVAPVTADDLDHCAPAVG